MGLVSEIRNIVVLTGAGISAESGLATFRGPDGKELHVSIEPRCDANDSMPVIGVGMPQRLKLLPPSI